ncbi:MAG: hypothetical protein ACI86M_001078 [Saprospiraceae bacterium]|jgi:hypothetical protein
MNWPLFAWFLVFVLIRKEGVEKYTTVWGVFLFAAYLKLIYLSKKHQPDMKSQHHKAVSHFDDSVILKKKSIRILEHRIIKAPFRNVPTVCYVFNYIFYKIDMICFIPK